MEYMAPNSYALPIIKNFETNNIMYGTINDIVYLFNNKYVDSFNLNDNSDRIWNKHTVIQLAIG